MARYGLLLKRRLGVPVVLREHNVETVILQRLACQAGSFVGWYLKLQAKRLAMYEARVCRLFDVVATISEEDDRRLQEMAPGVDSIVAPAGVDTSYYTPTLGPEEPNTLVHVGSLEWPPHVHGMKWFLCNVFPLIRRRVPDVKLKLIGKIPPGFQRYAASFPGVIPIGYVEDVRPHVARAAVYVVPLLAGGGIRLKLLEAFAMGKAVVTTSVGTEGIKANHDEHLLIADTPDLFATSVIRLLASPSTRSELGKKARHLVETNYTWDVCIRQLERAYAKALGKSRAERH
jgi:glycosyltransferase involved in cell wall biosynthesis